MAFGDFVRVAAAATKNAIHEIDQGLSTDPDYLAVRGKVKSRTATALSAARGKIQEAGETETGRRVGERSRQIGATISKAPVFSAVGDVMSHQAGVPELLAMRSESPDDPWPLVWLAEGMGRMNRRRGQVLAVRAAFEPISAFVAVTARTTAALGTDDPITRCQRGAWALALRTLNDDPTNLSSLHVLARVYLARGFPAQAAPLAAMAALADLDGDLALVTLAVASRASGEHDQARATAALAIEAGCSLGYDIQAEYSIDQKMWSHALELRGRILSVDRRRYSGVDPQVADIVRATTASQAEKASALTKRVQTLIEAGDTHV